MAAAEDRVAFANRMRLLVRLQSPRLLCLPVPFCADTALVCCACPAEPEGQRQPGRVSEAGVLQAEEGTRGTSKHKHLGHQLLRVSTPSQSTRPLTSTPTAGCVCH